MQHKKNRLFTLSLSLSLSLSLILASCFLVAPEALAVCGTDTVQDADGNTYHTVRVNNQCWMAENMNVGTKLATGATEPANNGTIEKWCYNNDDGWCNSSNHDGGLYNWNEAMQYSATEGAQGICPSGWHIPKDSEWYALENYLKDPGQTCNANRNGVGDCSGAGTKLLEYTGGTSGMNFPLSGVRIQNGSYVVGWQYNGVWSSSESGGSAWYRGLHEGNDPSVIRQLHDKSLGWSVRCIRNPNSTPPVTTSSLAEGQYNSQKDLTLTCTDDSLECDQIYYTTDGSTPTTGSTHSSSPLNLTISSTTTIKYFSQDYSSNSESIQTKTYTIDTTAPDNSVSDINLNSDDNQQLQNLKTTYINKTNLKLEGQNTEAENGQIQIYQKTKNGGKHLLKTIAIDANGNWKTTLNNFKNGKTSTLYFQTTDEVGNQSNMSKGYDITTDKTDPKFTNIVNKNKIINFLATDNETDIAYYKLQLIQGNKTIKPWRKQHSASYQIPADVSKGIYTLIIRAYDKAGNRAEKKIVVTVK